LLIDRRGHRSLRRLYYFGRGTEIVTPRLSAGFESNIQLRTLTNGKRDLW
jgi:hypothetical protein